MSSKIKEYAKNLIKSTLFGIDKDVSIYGNVLQINSVVVTDNVEGYGGICDEEALEAFQWVNVELWKLDSSKTKNDTDLKESFDFLQEVMFDRLAVIEQDYDRVLKGYRISAIESHENNWTQDDDDYAREQEERENVENSVQVVIDDPIISVGITKQQAFGLVADGRLIHSKEDYEGYSL